MLIRIAQNLRKINISSAAKKPPTGGFGSIVV